jgi:hypothetical protein
LPNDVLLTRQRARDANTPEATDCNSRRPEGTISLRDLDDDENKE